MKIFREEVHPKKRILVNVYYFEGGTLQERREVVVNDDGGLACCELRATGYEVVRR